MELYNCVELISENGYLTSRIGLQVINSKYLNKSMFHTYNHKCSHIQRINLLNLDLIFVMSYGVLCIFKCRIQLTHLSLLMLSSQYSEKPFWISHTVLFLCHLKVCWLEEIANFTCSAVPTCMSFKGVSLYVMSLKGKGL